MLAGHGSISSRTLNAASNWLYATINAMAQEAINAAPIISADKLDVSIQIIKDTTAQAMQIKMDEITLYFNFQ